MLHPLIDMMWTRTPSIVSVESAAFTVVVGNPTLLVGLDVQSAAFVASANEATIRVDLYASSAAATSVVIAPTVLPGGVSRDVLTAIFSVIVNDAIASISNQAGELAVIGVATQALIASVKATGAGLILRVIEHAEHPLSIVDISNDIPLTYQDLSAIGGIDIVEFEQIPWTVQTILYGELPFEYKTDQLQLGIASINASSDLTFPKQSYKEMAFSRAKQKTIQKDLDFDPEKSYTI